MATRRNKRSVGKSRRGSRKSRGYASVEGLHTSFNMIDGKVKELIAKGATDSDLAYCIKKAWTAQFHMDISAPAVKGMIMHYRAVHGKGHPAAGRKTRKAKGRKQKGGMAPIDYTMGQGTTDFVYGRFPVEIATTPQVIRALDNQRFFESNGSRACNTTGGHAAQGQNGGGLFDSLAMGFSPASVPRNFVETSVSAVQGAPIANPDPSPVSARVALTPFDQRAYAADRVASITQLKHVYPGY